MEAIEKKILFEIHDLIFKLESEPRGEIVLPFRNIRQPDGYVYKQCVQSILRKILELEKNFAPDYLGDVSLAKKS